MKLAAFHKNRGDEVEWVDYLSHYHRVYQSKVFTFTQDVQTIVRADEVVRGGTGYGLYDELPCESTAPDYFFYPKFQHALGFLTRGCVRHCPWCIVPRKEGGIRPVAEIQDILRGRKSAVLMDNNILAAGDHCLRQLEEIARLGCRVDFNQGLDSRLVTDEVAKLLARIKWIEFVRFACDTDSAVAPLARAVQKLNSLGIKGWRIFVYVLVKDVEGANRRCEELRRLGVRPFAQPYRDFTTGSEPTEKQKRFARYVNHKGIFFSTTWEKYQRKDFSPHLRNNPNGFMIEE